MQTEMLEVFREVARHRSITGAATALRYTQSAVSRQIAALELEVGARLFDRLPRGVALTAEGTCLLTHATAVLDRLALARREVDAVRAGASGHLRVGAFATADAALVPRALARFRAGHPGVRLSLVEGVTGSLLSALLAGDADVVLVTACADPRFAVHHVLSEPVLLAVPRAHPLAGTPSVVRLAALADEAWIAGSAAPEETLLAPSVRLGFRPRIAFVAGEWTAKLGFVAAGLGVTLVPALAARAAPADVALLPLHPDEVPPRDVLAATLAGRTVPATVTAFLTALRAEAALFPAD
ncbi:LysR family transcriptional regulator [Dactylosporangium aurantiacum]|uniref:LysR family transcriptional regulator n=1 Tax=Dactylosporangium aurantiacum TaxID=35754 RepID=UPI000523F97A|nr:LysR substrate-binding domain-containing protein [Dactylosporangium aurantiacum]MDG6104611.1 LysR substrate-binding domain-containing protein [Dactylosporangium aurantiacum]